ncbi:MAG: hypothetical protein ACHP7F_02985 [Actinomycetales bacterium]|nr:hypothetical protein [Leifsonia sp.]
MALLLTGCTPAVPTTPGASAGSTSTPTPKPATAATVRVPTTCQALVPRHDVDAAAGAATEPAVPTRTHTPVSYTDDRVGALTCAWKVGTGGDASNSSSVTITIVPGVTKQAFDDRRHGISVGGTDVQAAFGDDSYTVCYFEGTGTGCSFAELANGYGVLGGVYRAGTQEDKTLAAADSALFGQVNGAVVALASPAPLWEPSGPTVHGVSTCDGIATPAQISAVFPATDPHEVKGEGGEDAISTLGAAQLVGAYYCIVGGLTGVQYEAGLRLAVLPGGASYVAAAKRADPQGTAAQGVSGIGDSAFYYPATGTLDVVAGNGWVQVALKGAQLDKLELMARAVISNLA